MNNLSENLKRIRKERNLSQEALAEQLGVSRQSVSKWESSQAYPEMEKIVLICKLYNVSVDVLLNGNIKKVEKEEKTKINFGKYFNDFLNYMSKVFDVFSCMKFKEKVKCLFEQIVVIVLLILFFYFIQRVFINIAYSLVEAFQINSRFFYDFLAILDDIYKVFEVLFGAVILFQLFKIRYLDYYVIATSEDDTSKFNESGSSKKSVSFEKKEKIIIRDSKHSSYRFINGLLKIVLFFIKMFLIFIGIFITLGVIFSAIIFVLSFSVIKTGLLFSGLFIFSISSMIFLVNLLILIFNFLFNRKSNILIFIVCFIISIVLFGSSFGLVAYGATKFDIVTLDEIQESKEYVIDMKDDLYLESYYNITYITEERNDVKIVYYDTKFIKLNIVNNENSVIFYTERNYNTLKYAENVIDNLNKFRIVDDNIIIKVYASSENIVKLKNNINSYYY